MAEDDIVEMTRIERQVSAADIVERMGAFAVVATPQVGQDGLDGLNEIAALFRRLAWNEGLVAAQAGVRQPSFTRADIQGGVHYLEALVLAWHKEFDAMLTPEQKTEAYAIHAAGYDVFVSGGYSTRSGGGGK